jgi:hypothetical protein
MAAIKVIVAVMWWNRRALLRRGSVKPASQLSKKPPMSTRKAYLGLVNDKPMKAPVETTINAHAAQYQSLPRTVMWLLTVTVLVKPFTFNAPLPISSVLL